MLRVKYLRIVRELSQRQLAELASINPSELSRIETGRLNPSDHELKALARVLGCAPQRLTDDVSASSLEEGVRS